MTNIQDNIKNTNHTVLKSLPAMERPREKLNAYGASSLSNAELLAILLGTGTQGSSALSLAERILSADSSGMLFLNDCTPEELCRIEGVGPAKSAVLIAAAELGRRLTTAPRQRKINASMPEDIAALFMQKMRYLKKECFKVLLLNIKNEIISIEEISIGSLSCSEAHPREVFAPALRRGAANVILVHNHPSGSPEPSQTDIELTKRLIWAGKILGISVLDHIIIGDGIYTSMKREKLIA
jgi:DNA repair protein RadC